MDIEELLQAARQHEANEAWDEAAETYAQALALRPGDAHLLNSYGAALEELERWEEAEQSYRAALVADPGLANAHYNLGMFYRERGRDAEAVTELRAFLAARPDSEDRTEVMGALDELSAPTLICGNCGCVSPLTRLFRPTGRGKVLCPRCLGDFAQRTGRKLTRVVVVALGLLVVWVLALAALGLAIPALLQDILFITIAVGISTVGSLLAQALAGWLTGGKVYELSLGDGPDLYKLRLGDLLVRVRRNLGAGYCIVFYPPARQQRWRTLFVLLAGMIFHLLVIVACGAAAGDPISDSARAWLGALRVANIILLATRILFTLQEPVLDALVRPYVSRFRQTLTMPWDATWRSMAAYITVALLTEQRGEYAKAEAAARAATEVAPNNPLAMNMYGGALLDLGRYAEARDVFEALIVDEMVPVVAELVANPDRRLSVRAANRNNLASALLMLESDRPGLERARDLVETAFATAPWLTCVEDNLGASMIETGEVEEGLRHLEAARKYLDTAHDVAANLAWQALGYHRLGQPKKAQALLDEAARLDAAHPTLPIIRQRIRAAEGD